MIRRPLPAMAWLALAGTPALAATQAGTVHVVETGETLNGIAHRAGVAPEAIAQANRLKPPYVVKAGQKLAIPRDVPQSGRARPAAAATDSPEAGRTAASAQNVARKAAAASAQTEDIHEVQPGETLGGIARRAGVARVLIIEANGLQPPYGVRIGQQLKIPRTRRYAVKPGDSSFAIAMRHGVPWEQIALANGLAPEAPARPGQSLLIPTLVDAKSTPALPRPTAAPAPAATAPVATARFLWPVGGDVRRAFSAAANRHDGIDIKAPAGTMVRAAAAGTVKFAGMEKEQFGNLVVLDHGGGWFTAYGFLSRVTVKEGARVAAGERIGLVGHTGLAKGDELHFEARHDGAPVDPLDELPKRP